MGAGKSKIAVHATPPQLQPLTSSWMLPLAVFVPSIAVLACFFSVDTRRMVKYLLRDRKAPIKLLFPPYKLPFLIPMPVPPSPPTAHPFNPREQLVTKIDSILRDMEKKSFLSQDSQRVKLPSGRYLELASPGDWVLVDVEEGTLIHSAGVDRLIVPGGSYVVVPMRGCDVTVEDLRWFVKEGTGKEVGDEGLPGYTAG